jgi:putative ABC transport system substrate-binding protein
MPRGPLNRRDFVSLSTGAVAAWPLAAGAQQPATPVIGCLHVASADPFAHLIADFSRALNEAGYSEGRNVVIEFRGQV